LVVTTSAVSIANIQPVVVGKLAVVPTVILVLTLVV